MLDRPNDLPLPVRQTEQVKLKPGETAREAYQAWFERISVRSRFCIKHRHRALDFTRDGSAIWPVYERDEFHNTTKPKPGEFNCRAVFDCPACRIAYARCPPEFHDTSFDSFDTSTPERAATIAKAREFSAQVNKHGRGFALLVGPPGRGKTRLACNVIGQLEHRATLYVRQSEVTCALRASYGRKDVIFWRSLGDYRDSDAEDAPTLLETTQRMRFLALDEIGCTALANDERLFLDELLKHRYEHRKPTILISNLPLTGTSDKPGLKEFLGDALTDRIQEATGNGKFIVQFAGESYRRTIGETYLQGTG